MDELAVEILRDFYSKKGFPIRVIGKPYYGDQCIVIFFELSGNRYYNKFFINTPRDSVMSEVAFVEYLRCNNISVPEFLELDYEKVFYTDNNRLPAFFYATKAIVNDNDTADISPELIELFIAKISEMHLVSMKYYRELPGVKKISDYQKLLSLYIKYKQLIDRVGFGIYVKKAIEIGTDPVNVYPIHSDLHTANILTLNNGFVAFVDFSDLRYSGFEDDLGKLMQNLLGAKQMPISEVEKYVKLYEKNTRLAISRKNLYVSIVFHVLERFVDKCSGDINAAYVQKLTTILNGLSDYYYEGDSKCLEKY